MLRGIHIIPDTSLCPEIEALRQCFDWLHPFLPAHITLVFPFDLPGVSDEDLIDHCQRVANEFMAFDVSLLPPERSGDDHCWLPVGPHALLDKLAARLHGGPLSALSPHRRKFMPHITLARPPLAAGTLAAIRAFWPSGPVVLSADSITLESIHAGQRSEVLACLALHPSAC